MRYRGQKGVEEREEGSRLERRGGEGTRLERRGEEGSSVRQPDGGPCEERGPASRKHASALN